MSYAALNQYRTTAVYGDADEASPHKLVEMLYGGVIERLATARGALQRGDRAAKLRALSAAMAIVEHLRLSLDHAAGGEIAANLDALYDYIGRRLLHVNLHDDIDAVDELLRLARGLKTAWDGVAPVH